MHALTTPACPVCGGPFEVDNVNAVTVATCAVCEGVWLSEGDLDRATGAPLEAELRGWMRPPTECRYCHQQLGFGKTCLHCGKEPTIECPRGHGVMRTALVNLGQREFEIDECGTCHGLWIDAHEVGHLDAAPPLEVRQFERFENARVRAAAGHPRSLTDGIPGHPLNSTLHALDFLTGGIGGWSPYERSESGVIVAFLFIGLIAIAALYFFGGALLTF